MSHINEQTIRLDVIIYKASAPISNMILATWWTKTQLINLHTATTSSGRNRLHLRTGNFKFKWFKGSAFVTFSKYVAFYIYSIVTLPVIVNQVFDKRKTHFLLSRLQLRVMSPVSSSILFDTYIVNLKARIWISLA